MNNHGSEGGKAHSVRGLVETIPLEELDNSKGNGKVMFSFAGLGVMGFDNGSGERSRDHRSRQGSQLSHGNRHVYFQRYQQDH